MPGGLLQVHVFEKNGRTGTLKKHVSQVCYTTVVRTPRGQSIICFPKHHETRKLIQNHAVKVRWRGNDPSRDQTCQHIFIADTLYITHTRTNHIQMEHIECRKVGGTFNQKTMSLLHRKRLTVKLWTLNLTPTPWTLVVKGGVSKGKPQKRKKKKKSLPALMLLKSQWNTAYYSKWKMICHLESKTIFFSLSNDYCEISNKFYFNAIKLEWDIFKHEA